MIYTFSIFVLIFAVCLNVFIRALRRTYTNPNAKKYIWVALILFVFVVILKSPIKYIIGLGIYTQVDSAYFDYSDSVVKTRVHVSLGYLPLCLAFGCPSNPAIIMPLFSKTLAYRNECQLLYINPEKWLSDIKQKYGGYTTFIESRQNDYDHMKATYSLDYFYQLTCGYNKYSDTPDIMIPSPYSTYAVSNITEFDPAKGISAYPDTLGLLIKRGYKLPDANNPTTNVYPSFSIIRPIMYLFDSQLMLFGYTYSGTY